MTLRPLEVTHVRSSDESTAANTKSNALTQFGLVGQPCQTKKIAIIQVRPDRISFQSDLFLASLRDLQEAFMSAGSTSRNGACCKEFTALNAQPLMY